MSKVFECGAVFPGCKFVIHGDSDDELMLKAIESGSEKVSHWGGRLVWPRRCQSVPR